MKNKDYQELEDKDLYSGDIEKISKNHNTPPEILNHLINHPNWWIRCNVAENPNTSLETLRKLSSDENFYVRCEIAMKPNSSIEILRILSKDKDSHVRGIAIENLIKNYASQQNSKTHQ